MFYLDDSTKQKVVSSVIALLDDFAVSGFTDEYDCIEFRYDGETYSLQIELTIRENEDEEE